MSKVYPLQGSQMAAVNPVDTVWLSASAGTGKTQVLSARVLRLLLQEGVSPGEVLCLTFTKAGAAEMAVRVNEVLADWVRMPETSLAADLAAIGAPNNAAACARARTLFASVLDCPGGGLRIDTIHAFSQWLLSAFPEEAGLTPGTRAMEDRDRLLLSREVLSALLLDAEDAGDEALLDALSGLSIRMKPEDVEAWLLRCAEAREAWFGPGSWQTGDLRREVRCLLGLDENASEETLTKFCSDDGFDVESLRVCQSAYQQWNTKTGQEGRVVIADWLAASDDQRLVLADDLFKVLFTQKDTVKKQETLEKFEEYFGSAAEAVLQSMLALREQRQLLALAEWLAPALVLGRTFAIAWDEAKTREGLIDFDDQIRQAAALLSRSDLSDWIRYKLDRRFDHILIDEAQDTNAAQWQIIEALSGDFFAGEGQHGDALRTLFVVGDYKQAIFRFQGTSPENFERARSRVRAQIRGLAENVVPLRERRYERDLQDLGLGQSFRTAQSILQFVDKAIGHIGHERFGLKSLPEPHLGEDRPGLVTFWPPVGSEGAQADDDDEEGAEGWLSRPDRQLADRIARQVKGWIVHGFPLIKGTHRRAGPGDVMVLVRKRKELAGLIVARLHAAGVEVAGVDRLRLGAPLAVKDLVAALRFAVQPFDDLNLAALLVSPLVGWSQEQLLEYGYRPENKSLWDHLRASRESMVAMAVDQLLDLLTRADFAPPQALLHWLLVGPWRARERLVARLGLEANDPIDELVNAAHAYAVSDVPSLAGFLHWFDAGDGELKRESEGAGGLVRVMTVHGSKGLQAPIVILADAAGNPDGSRGSPIELRDPRAGQYGDALHAPAIPLPGLAKSERVGRIAEEHERARAAEREEHWRLLYVAMTRAEEALFITGSLGARESEPAEDSWYARLEAAADGEWQDDTLWGKRMELGSQPALPPVRVEALSLGLNEPQPRWIAAPLAAEPRPPRPLAPSSLGEDHSADPPFAPGAGADAARRGTLIHRLLERLPEVPAAEREAAALHWLARMAADLGEADHREMTTSALGVLDHKEWADLFGPQALAEVPIAALVGGQVIAGTIDRLLVSETAIRLVDFKTARRPPERVEQVQVSILKQMAAYAAALEAVYPGRRVEAALLYTSAPRLIAIPDALLAAQVASLRKTELSTGE